MSATSPFEQYGRGVQTIPLREDIMHQVLQLYKNDPTMQACRAVLYGVLFSGTIEIVKNGVAEEPTEEFATFLQRYWIPFAQDAADCIRAFGFVPYVIRPAPDSVNLMPLVPPFGTYGVEYTIDTNFQRALHMKARLQPMLQEVPNSHFFVVEWPTFQGEIQSAMMALAKGIVRKEVIERCAVEAELNAARPTLLTQSHKEARTSSASSTDRSILTGVSEWLNKSATAVAQKHQFDVDENMMSRLVAQREAAQTYNRATVSDMSDPASSALGTEFQGGTPGAALKGSVLTLPNGQEYVNQQQQRPHQSLVDVTHMVEDQICAMMGVPNSLIHPASSQYNSGALVQRMINTELYRVAQQLSVLMTQVYNHIYGGSDKSKSKRASKTASDTVEIKLRHPTFADPEMLIGIAEKTDLYKNEYVAELVARAAGFWDETQTEKFIRAQTELKSEERSQLAYENGLQMKLQKQAQQAQREASPQPQAPEPVSVRKAQKRPKTSAAQ